MKQKRKFKQTEIGLIPEDWNVDNLGNSVIKIFVGRDPAGGKQSHSDEKTNYAIIQSAPVFDGFLDREKVGHVSEEIYADFTSASLVKEDVLLNQLGDGITFARSCVVPNDILPAIITRSVGCIRCDRKKLDPWFLNAFLILPKTKEYIESFNSGSSRRAIDGAKMRSFLIPLPPLSEQKMIGHSYKILQDKIELNKKMSKTLEATGQAIFKRWFINFEFPNEKGKPYKSSGGEMVESELGEIPKGWQISRISEEATIKGGSTPSTENSEYWDGELYWCTPKDLSKLTFPVLLKTERKITQKGLDSIASGLLPKNSLLLSSRAPIGYLAISQIETAINQGFIGIICNKKLSSMFMLWWVKNNLDAIKNMANGSTFQEINKSDFRIIKILVPKSEVLQLFDIVVSSVFNKIIENEKESQNLSQIRDSLLPRIMSGKIRVPVEVRT